MRWDLTDEKSIKRMQRRVAESFRRMGGKGSAEDCFQEIYCRMLAGRHQHATIDQCVIDFIRVEYGNERSLKQSARKNAKHSDIHYQADWITDPRASARAALDNGIDFNRLLGCLRKRERQIMELYFYESQTEREIGTQFGISESRVSQIVDRATAKVGHYILAEQILSIVNDVDTRKWVQSVLKS